MRMRVVKPGFFKNEELFDLERESGLPIRVAYAGLWGCADRRGRFQWRPRQLKMDCLPYDDVDFESVLNALASRKFIHKYEVAGVSFGLIPTFLKHQRPNQHEVESVIPEPPESDLHMHARASSCADLKTHVQDCLKQEQEQEPNGNLDSDRTETGTLREQEKNKGKTKISPRSESVRRGESPERGEPSEMHMQHACNGEPANIEDFMTKQLREAHQREVAKLNRSRAN